MRKALTLLGAFCLALWLGGCGPAQEAQPETTDAPAFYEAGVEAAAQGDHAAAIDAFSQAIEADDSRAAAYAGRADSYLALFQAGETGSPDLKELALRDYGFALALDPALGERIHGVYADLAEQALAAGDSREALRYLYGAMETAAQEDEADRIRERARALTDELLTGSVWYVDAPDSAYYELLPDGTGRAVSAVVPGRTEALTYENEGFAVLLTGDGGDRTGRWTYDPERACFCADVSAASAEDGVLSLSLQPVGLGQMYRQWQAAILAEEADLRLSRLDEGQKSAGYGALYGLEADLAEELAGAAGEALTAEDALMLQAEWARRDAVQADGTLARDAFGSIQQTIGTLLRRLPEEPEATAGPALGEIFPVGEPALLDCLRLTAGWVLAGRGLTVPEDGGGAAWESLADVAHYFQEGRLYLCLEGCGLREASGSQPESLVADTRGRFVIGTPLSLESDVTATGEELLSRLRGERWIGLWDMGYDSETLLLELDLAEDMTCAVQGGYYPEGASGRQSGQYALEGNELTLILAAEGYSAGTYRYRVLPMGDSLYMTLLTEGIVYGQSAGSAYLFCGADYAAGAGVDPDRTAQGRDAR